MYRKSFWRLAVPDATLKPSDSNHTRDVFGHRDEDSTIAITQLGEDLVRAQWTVTNERKKETDHHIWDLGRTVAKVDNPQLGSSWREAERNVPITDPGGQDSLALCTRLECKAQSTITQELCGRQ